LYTSEQAHSSVEKAAIALGIGRENVRKIPADAAFRMDVAALRVAVREDRAAGFEPFCVVATVGTTSTTSADPVPGVADLCEEEELWLHVDAAYAGAAAIVPEYRHILAGCDRAASIVINPHKWLFTPIDCSALFTRRPDVLESAFSLVPEYLRTDAAGVRNYMDYGIQLGRRFRALKLWMVLRYFGSDGIAARLRHHIELARTFAGWVDEDPDFERLAPTPLSVVCFRARPGAHDRWWDAPRTPGRETPGRDTAGRDDEAGAERLDALNLELLKAVNASGEVYLSHTRLHGRYALRLAVGNIRTTERHVRRAWELLHREYGRLTGNLGSDA
jgi:aromatic-L-amino-acid decarboxylase